MLCVCLHPFCAPEKNKNHCLRRYFLSWTQTLLVLHFFAFHTLPPYSPPLPTPFLLPFFSYPLPFLSPYLPPLPHHHLTIMGHLFSFCQRPVLVPRDWSGFFCLIFKELKGCLVETT